jgi:multidrug efflux system membrane fusion protein
MRSAEAGVATAAAGFDSTRARIQSAEAGVATAKKEIERLTINAPFEGALESDTLRSDLYSNQETYVNHNPAQPH